MFFLTIPIMAYFSFPYAILRNAFQNNKYISLVFDQSFKTPQPTSINLVKKNRVLYLKKMLMHIMDIS